MLILLECIRVNIIEKSMDIGLLVNKSTPVPSKPSVISFTFSTFVPCTTCITFS